MACMERLFFGGARSRPCTDWFFAAKVQPQLADEGNRPPETGGAMKIVLSSGESYTAALDNARGCPANPLPDEQLVEKFVNCAGRARVPIDATAANGLADAILDLERCRDVGSLFA